MTKIAEWEKEFDKKRPTMEFTNSNGEGATNDFGYKYTELDEIHEVTDWGNIKSFIRSLLAQQRSELLDQVEKEVIEDSFDRQIMEAIRGQSVQEYQRLKLSVLRKEGGNP